jgi:hypothetical protein
MTEPVKEQTVEFKFEKETKNTVKFSEVPVEGEPPIIGTLYVQKFVAIRNGAPIDGLSVTVHFPD